MVPANELAAMQATVTGVMDQAVKIERPTSSKGTWAETLNAWTTLSASTPCLLSMPTSSQLERFLDLIGEKTSWRVMLPSGTTVARNDRLTIAGSGDVLRVQAVEQPQSYSLAVDVIATEVR